MKNKKMSIRILFPLIMSVSIAFCIISCMILFSHYLSAYFIQKTVEDTNRQKNVLAQNIENEIESINDTINTIYYDTIKKYEVKYQCHAHNTLMGKFQALSIMILFSESYLDDNECFEKVCKRICETTSYESISLSEYSQYILKMPI